MRERSTSSPQSGAITVEYDPTLREGTAGRGLVEGGCLGPLPADWALAIGIGAPGNPRRPLPHHLACGSAPGGSGS